MTFDAALRKRLWDLSEPLSRAARRITGSVRSSRSFSRASCSGLYLPWRWAAR